MVTSIPRLKVSAFLTNLPRLKVSNGNRHTQTWDECLQITLLDKNYSLWILATWLRTDKLIMCWQISIIEITVLSYLMTQTFFKVKCNSKYSITEKLKWHIFYCGVWNLKSIKTTFQNQNYLLTWGLQTHVKSVKLCSAARWSTHAGNFQIVLPVFISGHKKETYGWWY